MRPFLRSVILFSLPALFAFAGETGPFTGPDADAEAARLYERATNYVTNVNEGPYSYSYIQFHWKRASSNIDRILRAYPYSPTARQIAAGELQVGPFAPLYLKERVLPRLEEKKVGSFDAVNNAIFLYYLENNKDVKGRRALLEQIIVTLCRQKRWGEALNFPVLDENLSWLWRIVTRQASYIDDQLTDKLVANSQPADQPALMALIAESRAFRGDTLEELNEFLHKNSKFTQLRSNVFAGLVRREIAIQRTLQLNHQLKSAYDGVDAVENPEQRVDLNDYFSRIPAGPTRQSASREFARYLAAVGKLHDALTFAQNSDLPVLLTSFAGYLIAKENYQQAIALPDSYSLTAEQIVQYRIKLIELLAQAGRDVEASTIFSLIPDDMKPLATYHDWRGRILSTKKQLVVREHTFANIALDDPNLIGRLICEWSLTPNRALRGAAPWDAIVFKFAPGFEDLPLPEEDEIEAAGR